MPAEPKTPSASPSNRSVPERPSLEGIEAKWMARWRADGTYRFEAPTSRDEVFSIDTPPPTASGSLHVGHMFSYTHTDCIARFQRMTGKQVFYPMGWDDNGVPTERRVENYYGVRCDPTVPFDPGFQPPAQAPKERRDFVPISRPNFVNLCYDLTAEDEKTFEDLFSQLGLSVDWGLTYTTISERSRRTSQRAFLRNYHRGEAYSAEAPCMWDTTFQMAVSQAELEDRERPGFYHDVNFEHEDGSKIMITTSRPELLASCVAVVAHPEDERYAARFNTMVTTPLFGVEVPLLPHPLADPEKGTGAAMVCTFGDLTDVIWWRELDLPARAVIERNGRFASETPEWITLAEGRTRYEDLAGKTAKQARAIVVEQLNASGDLVGEPKPISHPVKFYEKGELPLEIVQSRQWYIRNGGRDRDLAGSLIAAGDQLAWHPAYMQARYTNWIDGLNGDWLISRQRYFGVPIPVWYPITASGTVDYTAPIVPAEAALPIDPQSEVPPGYVERQRNQPGGFVGDPDVMDTWATSSLTPQLACGWEEDPQQFSLTFPMDLRPQGHDIIRTWLFSTMVRSYLEFGRAPWANAALSGWILDPDRKKMSKSKGNVVVPKEHLDQHGSDAVRYWSASARPGTDTAFDVQQMKVGRRLAIKVLNASRFVLGFPPVQAADDAELLGLVTEPVDLAMLASLRELIDTATVAFQSFDYARALERTEAFFWNFCDNHVELVKVRAYGEGEGAQSARAALQLGLSALLRLFAPCLPFVTEEVWSWWMPGSIHRADWPKSAELAPPTLGDEAAENPQIGEVAARVLGELRRAKTEAKLNMKATIELARVRLSEEELEPFLAAASDVADAGSVQEWDIAVAEEFSVETVGLTQG